MRPIQPFAPTVYMPKFGNNADRPVGKSAPNPEALSDQLKLPVPGMALSLRRKFSAQAIADFAKISGDHNPIHLLKSAAQAAGFEDILAHGAFVNAQFSTALVKLFKGVTPIYGAQNTQFTAPVYAEETVESEVSVKSVEYKPGKKPGTGSFFYGLDTNAWVIDPQTHERKRQVIKGTAQGVVRVTNSTIPSTEPPAVG